MDQTALIKQIKATIGKPKVLELGKLLIAKQFDLHDLIAVTLYPDEPIAFRASWLLENIFLQHPELYLPHLEYLLANTAAVTSSGAKRHYAKIIMHITDARASPPIKTAVDNLNFDGVVEQLFDWMIDPTIKIAVKAFSAEGLFNLRHRYPWIAAELADQLHYLMRNGTAAIQSKGKKLLNAM